MKRPCLRITRAFSGRIKDPSQREKETQEVRDREIWEIEIQVRF